MSYEYEIKINSTSENAAQNFFNEFLDHCFVRRHDKTVIDFKEPKLNSQAQFDVRLSIIHSKALWLQVNFRCPEICRLFIEKLIGVDYVISEDGDFDCVTSVQQAFRIRD